jgi:hypothetical protein
MSIAESAATPKCATRLRLELTLGDNSPSSATPAFSQRRIRLIRSCLKNPQASARQGESRRESAVYMRVNEHFELIFNAVLCRMRGFSTASKARISDSMLDEAQ